MPRCLDQPANPYIHTKLYDKTFGQREAQSSALPTPQSGDRPPEPVYSIPYHAVELVEPRMDLVRASVWTSVTSDDAMVRDLLRIFFVYEYPSINCFHKDLFLKDMVCGRKRFCSRALVNAVLACACHGQTQNPNRADFWDPTNIKYLFTAETKRLLELERGVHKLTSVQATLLLAINCDRDGTDKVGMAYLAQAVSMANSLGLMSSLTDRRESALRKAKAITAWSLFAWQSLVCHFMAMPPLCQQPPVEVLPSWERAPEYFGEVWLRYPLDKRLWPLRSGLLFRAYADLFSLVNDANVRRLSVGRRSEEDARNLYSRLTGWYSALPQSLRAETAVLPSQLNLHMFFHSLVLGAFEPLATQRFSGSVFTQPALHRDSATYIASYASACLETLLRLYYLRHGAAFFDTFVLQFWNMMGFRALKSSHELAAVPPQQASEEERKDVLSTLILCATSMREQGRNYYLSEIVYRILRDNMGVENARRLPVLDDPKAEEWRDSLMRRHARAEYPVNVLSLGEDVDDWRISQLVETDGSVSGDDGSLSSQ